MVSIRKLIELLNGHRRLGLETGSEIHLSMKLASKNKVLLHLLRVLDIHGSLRESQERVMRNIAEVVKNLSKALNGHDYAFFKLVKPISYVPADIDLLINAYQVKKAAKEVMGVGYWPVVKDP
ncbi:hypothetical protein KEJ19_08055 [Candidatus Bathyarchaeota archaeon]|nr:hypothetical protein [Candidatus Bathyarchaeota archaeon]